jgi:hypothetical protein
MKGNKMTQFVALRMVMVKGARFDAGDQIDGDLLTASEISQLKFYGTIAEVSGAKSSKVDAQQIQNRDPKPKKRRGRPRRNEG